MLKTILLYCCALVGLVTAEDCPKTWETTDENLKEHHYENCPYYDDNKFAEDRYNRLGLEN